MLWRASLWHRQILFCSNSIREEQLNNSFRNEVGVICVKNINFTSRPYVYFSEQGNVDDDATFITIFLVSFNLQSCCLMQSAVCGLQSAVCSLQMSYTGSKPKVSLQICKNVFTALDGDRVRVDELAPP